MILPRATPEDGPAGRPGIGSTAEVMGTGSDAAPCPIPHDSWVDRLAFRTRAVGVYLAIGEGAAVVGSWATFELVGRKARGVSPDPVLCLG